MMVYWSPQVHCPRQWWISGGWCGRSGLPPLWWSPTWKREASPSASISVLQCWCGDLYCFQSLSDSANKSTAIATTPQNKLKNHFANICVCKWSTLLGKVFWIICVVCFIHRWWQSCDTEASGRTWEWLHKRKLCWCELLVIAAGQQVTTLFISTGICYTKEIFGNSRYIHVHYFM